MSRSWAAGLRWFYGFLRLIDPLVRRWWSAFGIGNVVKLVVRDRRTGRRRSVLLGLLGVGDRHYLGHPNGDVGWTRDLEAAGIAEVRRHRRPPMVVRAVLLPRGDERDAAIRATWNLGTGHPFPGNVIYWLARGHIRAVGVFFRLEEVPSP